MSKQRFETGKAPSVHVDSCPGDLVVRSWMEPAVSAQGDFEVEETDAGVTVHGQGDLVLMVPFAAALSIGQVGGDAVVKNGSGHLHVEEVGGDLVLQNSAEAKIGTVHGDIAVADMTGSLAIETVHGDMAVRNVDGDVAVGSLFGDLAMRSVTGSVDLGVVSGDISLATVNGAVHLKKGKRDANFKNMGGQLLIDRVNGDIRLRGGLSATDHSLMAKGDIVVRWPIDAPLNLVVNAAQIQNKLPLEDLVEKEGQLIGRLGDGKTSLTLTADGRVQLKDAQMIDPKWGNGSRDNQADFNFDFDFAGLGARISQEINDKVTRFTGEIENRFGGDFGQRMAGEAVKRAEEAAARAEQSAQRAKARAPQPPPPPPPPKAPNAPSPASAEEQLKILKMVEDGTISPDEATVLLDALGS